jgi:hypothetical protein
MKNRLLTKHDKKPMPVLLYRPYEEIHDIGMQPFPNRGRNCAAAIDRWVNEGGAIGPERASRLRQRAT